MSYSMEHAIACAGVIKKSAKIPVMIYAFGSCTRGGGANDVDLLLEVDCDTFDNYLHQVTTHGIHAQLKTVVDPDDEFWSYFSPTVERSKLALGCLGIDTRTWGKELNALVPIDDIDLICLPSNWRDQKTEIRRKLDASVRQHDQQFFSRLENTAKLAV